MKNETKNKTAKIILLITVFALIFSSFNISFVLAESNIIDDVKTDLPSLIPGTYSTDSILIKFKDNIDLKNPDRFEDGVIKTGLNTIDNFNKDYQADSLNKMFEIKEEMNTKGLISQDLDDILKQSGLDNIYELVFSQKNLNLESVIKSYSSLSDIVEYVEPNYKFSILSIMDETGGENDEFNESDPSSNDFPNDPGWSYQWHMQGFEQGGINVRDAWNISTGEGATVAVLDTGVNKYSDLADTNFVLGWNFLTNSPYASDDNVDAHGTHVAGTVAQSTNNGIGVCGVAYNANIMPIKVLNCEGNGYLDDIADGIYFATFYGADVISMSFGSVYDSAVLREAIRFAYSIGVTLVAAAGNDGSPEPMYPAAYYQVISVGATQYDKTKTYYSNFGANLDVVAPGGNINVDQNGDSYADGILQQSKKRYYFPCPYNCSRTCHADKVSYYFKQGTSFACPHVSGIAALLHSIGFSGAEVRNRIFDTAHDLGIQGKDIIYGHGLVDAYMALQKPCIPSDPMPTSKSQDVDLNIEVSVNVSDPDNDLLNVSFYCRIGRSINGQVEGPYLIGEVHGASSGSRVSVPWNNLMSEARYNWYVIVDDGEDTTQSAYFGFQTRTAEGPPYIPSSPYPDDDEKEVSVNTALSFDGGDPGLFDTVSYDLYFGTSQNPSFYTTIGSYPATQTRISYSPGELENNTKYYWKIIAEDSDGNITQGPVWFFTTTNPGDAYPNAYFTWVDDDGAAPSTLINFNAAGSSDNNGITLYEWDFDNDGIFDDTGETISYDFGDCQNHTVVLRVTDTIGQKDTYTQIVKAVSGPDNPPYPFFMWVDADGVGADSIINFDASLSYDDFEIISYEWDFNNDSIYDDTGETVSFDFGDYQNHTVVLRVTDSNSQSNTSTRIVKAFGLDDNTPPITPYNPDPENNSYEINVDTILSWYSGDFDTGDTVSYDIYLSKTNPPVLLESVYSTSVYSPSENLDYNQKYYWKIVAKDSYGLVSEGPVWSFTTEQNTDNPPFAFFTFDDNDGYGPGSLIEFNASFSSDDNGITSYEWDFNDDGIFDDTGEIVSYDYSDYDIHTVTLRVTDTIGQNDTFSSIVQAGFVENVTIDFTRPKSNMLYLFDREICSFPTTLVIGKLNVEVNVSVPEGVSVSRIVFYVDDVEKYNVSYDPESSVYGFCLDEKLFFKKTVSVKVFDADEEIACKSTDMFVLNLLG